MKTRKPSGTKTVNNIELALEGAKLGFWHWNLIDNSVQYDQRWCDILGLDFQNTEMTSSTWESLIHPMDREKWNNHRINYLTGSIASYEMTYRMKHANGNWIFVIDRARISGHDKSGRVTALNGTLFDVTIVEQSKEVLQQQHHLLKQLIEEMPVSIAMMDKRMCYVICSQKWMKDFNLVGKDILGKSHYTIFPKVPDRWKMVHKRALSGAIEKNHRESFVDASGNTLWFRIDCMPWYESDETMGGILMLTEDITEVVAAEEKLNQEAKSIALGLLSAGITFEIKNPLSVILNSAASLLSKLTTGTTVPRDKLMAEIAKISKCAGKIDLIIDGLRTLTKDGSKDPFTACSIKELLDHISTIFKTREKNDGVLLKIGQVDQNIEVYGQPQQLAQVLVSLVSNAFDAAKGSLPSKVFVNVSSDEERVRIEVTDTGAGVPDQVESKIFDPFYTTKPFGKGTGLGLSTSQSIAEKHGGRLELDRSISDSAFVLDLPILKNKTSAA